MLFKKFIKVYASYETSKYKKANYVICTNITIIAIEKNMWSCWNSLKWKTSVLQRQCPVLWATDWKEIFAKYTHDKGLLFKIRKKLLKLNNKKTIRFKNGPKVLTDFSPKKIHKWQVNIKRCSTSYVVKEMQMKTTMRCLRHAC